MTRRERHVRIIESWLGTSHPMTSSYVRQFVNDLLYRHGLDALTDAATEELAADLVRAKRRQAKMNIENRARRAAAGAL